MKDIKLREKKTVTAKTRATSNKEEKKVIVGERKGSKRLMDRRIKIKKWQGYRVTGGGGGGAVVNKRLTERQK